MSGFWKNRTWTDYQAMAKRWKRDEKLPWDMLALIPPLMGVRKVYDMCCGDGRMVRLLDEVFGFDLVLASDVNRKLVKHQPIGYSVAVADMNELEFHPRMNEVDTMLWLGACIYVVDDAILDKIVGAIAGKGKRLILRTACTEEDVLVNEPSRDFPGETYEARYRMMPRIVEILRGHFAVVKRKLPYPPKLESRPGATQWLFEANP